MVHAPVKPLSCSQSPTEESTNRQTFFGALKMFHRRSCREILESCWRAELLDAYLPRTVQYCQVHEGPKCCRSSFVAPMFYIQLDCGTLGGLDWDGVGEISAFFCAKPVRALYFYCDRVSQRIPLSRCLSVVPLLELGSHSSIFLFCSINSFYHGCTDEGSTITCLPRCILIYFDFCTAHLLRTFSSDAHFFSRSTNTYDQCRKW